MFLTWLGHRGQVIGEEDQQRIRTVITPWVRALCYRFVGNGELGQTCHP